MTNLKRWLFTFFIFSCHYGWSAPEGLTLQGRLVKDSLAVVGAVTLTVQVTSPNLDACLLYEEAHALNLSADDEGSFSVKIGGGTRTSNDKGFSLVNIFSNRNAPLNGLSCTGSSATSYTPSSSDSRYVYVRFLNGSETVVFNSPYVIQSVPYALEAERLDGKMASEYLQTTSDTTQSKLNSLMTNTSYTELMALLGGTSSKYMNSSTTTGTYIPSVSAAPLSPVAGQMWFDSVANVMKYYNGSSVQTVKAGTLVAGDIPNLSWSKITSGIPTTIAGYGITDAVIKGGQTGVLTLGTSDANSLTLNTNNSAKMTILSGGNVGIGTLSPDALLDVSQSVSAGVGGILQVTNPASTVAGNAVEIRLAPSSAHSTRYSAIRAINQDGNNNIDLQFFTGSGASITEKVRINSNGNVGIGTTNPTTTLSVSTGGSNGIQLGQDTATNANSGRLFFTGNNSFSLLNLGGKFAINYGASPGVSSGSTGFIMDSSGNIGIGTNSPVQPLDVNGNARISGAAYITTLSRGTDNATLTVNANSTGTNSGGQIEIAGVNSGVNPGTLVFKTSLSGSAPERMRIDANGSVGIGTASPSGRLDVASLPGVNASAMTAKFSTFVSSSGWNPGAYGTGILINGGNGVTGPGLAVGGLIGLDSNMSYTNTSSTMNGTVSSQTALKSTTGIDTTYASNAFTLSNVYGLNSYIQHEQATPTVTIVNAYGMYLNSSSNAQSRITNLYDIYANSANGKNYFAGKVGIGTTNPTSNLMVVGDAGAASIYGNVNDVRLNFDLSNWSYAKLNVRNKTESANRYLVLQDTGGNVGIGTTVVDSKLTIAGTTPEATMIPQSSNSVTLFGSGNTYFQGRDVLNDIEFIMGTSSSGTAVFAGAMTNHDFQLRTANNPVITMKNTGLVGIGTTSPSEKLHVVGNILASGTITPSDKRFKKNIETLPHALDKLLKIRGVEYDMRTEEYPDRGFTKDHQLGVIAQEVESVYPEVVHTDSSGYKAVSYQMLIAPLIESIKNLYEYILGHQKQLSKQAREISSLQKRNEELEAQNREILLRLQLLEYNNRNK